ncbi:MAG: disulfide isomerase DsbC N-terminal domain-containing protein [Candidatus Methanomethylicia archaeon]
MDGLRMKIFAFVIVFLVLTCKAFADVKDEIQRDLQKLFPGVKIESVLETPIPKTYAVFVQGSSILFYNTDGYFIFGEIWTKEGTNIAGILSVKRVLDKIRSKGLKPHIIQGNGKELILFVNPECFYCKQLLLHLSNYIDRVRLSIYLIPMPQFRFGTDLMLAILCSENPYKTLIDYAKGLEVGRIFSSYKCSSEQIKAYIKDLDELKELRMPIVPVTVGPGDEIVIGNNIMKINTLLGK